MQRSGQERRDLFDQRRLRGTDPSRVCPTVTASPFSDHEIARWRSEFPGLDHIIHVANCSQGAQSRRVRDAVERYMDNWRSVGMDWDGWVEEVDRARAVFARMMGCSAQDVGVVGSVSEAVSTVASAFDYRGARNRVLVSEAEFPTVGHVWLAHRKLGADVSFVPLTDGEIRLEDYDRMTDERTLLVSASHTYYQTGYKQDVGGIAEIVHRKGGILFVDAYQGLGTCPIDVRALDVDILASGNLKYLLGIPGIAFIYVRPELVARLEPAETGWFGQENPFSFDLKNLDYARTARRTQSGTPPVTAAFAARAGMELLLEVGLDRVGQQIDFLSAYCMRRALEKGMDVMSPLDVRKKGATTAIRVPGDSHGVEMALKQRNVVASARGPALRIAPHFFNTTEDIETALDQLSLVISETERR